MDTHNAEIKYSYQARVAALVKVLRTVVCLTIKAQVSEVIRVIRLRNGLRKTKEGSERLTNLKIVAVPARGSALARHNTARYSRDGGKGQRSDRKDENHCKKTVGSCCGENGQ